MKSHSRTRSESKLKPGTKGDTLQGKRRPGPIAFSDSIGPEKDLADAAVIIDLVERGNIQASMSRVEPSAGVDRSKTTQRLGAEEEALLARRVRTFGDIDARNTLVLANIGLVHLVANQFSRPSLRYEDLLQEGIMGLIRATETFEPERSIRFSTYSVYWIRARIQRLIERLDKDDVPRISGAELGVDNQGRKYRPRARKISIDRPVEGDESRTLGDILPSATEDPEDLALKHEKHKAIKEVLRTVVDELGDPRLTTVIEMRLLADEPKTLADVGQKLKLSREGARLLEAKMLKLARQKLISWHKPS